MLETVFGADGLRPVTVADLADRAGCSRRTLYDLAPSKEELFLLVLDRMLNRVAREAQETAALAADPARQITALLRSGALAMRPLTPMFFEALKGYAPAQWMWDHHLAVARRGLVDLIEAGIASGHLRAVHPVVAAEVLIASSRRLVDPGFLNASGLQVADALDELFVLVVGGLAESTRPRRRSGVRAA